jgi:hypothetical protein
MYLMRTEWLNERFKLSLSARADKRVAVLLIQTVGPVYELHLAVAAKRTSLHCVAGHVRDIGTIKVVIGYELIHTASAIAGIAAVGVSNALIIDREFFWTWQGRRCDCRTVARNGGLRRESRTAGPL